MPESGSVGWKTSLPANSPGQRHNILRDDFSEYNAKPYQSESRFALLNLCTYAYEDEVRLAARMVLDYISAHIAVSSCDLRRLVPFRRRNEFPRNRALGGEFAGVMSEGMRFVTGRPGTLTVAVAERTGIRPP